MGKVKSVRDRGRFELVSIDVGIGLFMHFCDSDIKKTQTEQE